LATTTGGTVTYTQPNGVSNGVGAYLQTTGSFNLIDTANVQTVGTRILVKNEGNAVFNGVYGWANATTIVRTTDTDEYGPDSTEALSLNDYFFVTSGNVNLGSSWVVNAPVGVITFGSSNISFGQFSQSQVYNAGNGIAISGTLISAKVDGVTTSFDNAGNIVVPANAQFTTPNIGAATGTSLSVTSTVTGGNLETGGTISGTGTITGGNLATGGTVSATSNITGGNVLTGGIVSATSNIAGGNILTAGYVSATGNVTGQYILGNGVYLSGVANAESAGKIQNGTSNVNIPIIDGNVTIGVGGTGDVVVVATTGEYVTGLLSVTGTVTGGNVDTAGTVSATGSVTGGSFNTLGAVSATGDVTGGNIVTAGQVTATGSVTGGSFNTIGAVSATGDVTGGNLVTAGQVTATGSVTGGSFNTIGTVSATGTVTGGNVETAGYISATGSVTGSNFYTIGAVSATGDVTGGNLATGGTVSATGTITGGDVNTGGNVSATGTVTGGNVVTGGIVSAAANITGGNILTGGYVSATGDVSSSGNASATGNVTGGNILTAGYVSATGNVYAANFIGNVSGNVTVPGANTDVVFNDAGVANATAGFTFDKISNAVTVIGTVTAGNVDTGGTVSATGNATVGNLLTGGEVSSTGNVTGGNILTGGYINATANVSGGNLYGNEGINSGNYIFAAGNVTGNLFLTQLGGIDSLSSNLILNYSGGDINTGINDGNGNIMFFVDAGTSTASFGSATQTVGSLVSFNASNSIKMPVGNTAQRPGTPSTGQFRFNTSSNSLEVFDNSQWTSVGVPNFTLITDQQFFGDGSTVVFTLSGNATTAGSIVSINGVQQLPVTAYAVAGTTLTFTEAPEVGDVIDVRVLTTSTTVTSISNSAGNAVVATSDTSATTTITGDLTVTGNVNIGGNVATNQINNGSSAVQIPVANGNVDVKVNGANVTVWTSQGEYVTGNVSVTGDVIAQNVNSLSDASLKTNVTAIDNAGNVVDALNGVGYDWKDGSGHAYGMIAQAVEEVLPEAVKTDENGIKSINYSMVIPFLVETVKELRQDIAEIRSQLKK
jgi:filamentous hemagglutinin